MTDKPLRICVVGAGDMGARHIKAWDQTEGCKVVAIVDDVAPRLEAAAAKLPGAKGYADYKQAITEAKPDVVSVCIPTAFHAPVSVYAMEHGAHVLCEKPMALTLTDADTMIETAQRKGVLLTVGFMLRYSAGIAQLKKWVSQGAIGRPILAVSENFMEVRPKVLMHAKNVNGGPLLDYWCHQFDLWGFLFESQPVSVSGYGMIFAQDKPEVINLGELAVDTAVVSIKYKSGDVGQLSTSWGLPKAFASRHIASDKLVGPQGMIFGDIRKQLTLVDAAGQSEEVNNGGVDWWQREIQAFAQTIKAGGTPLVSGQNGHEALRLSLAALEAVETGRTVML